MTLEHRFRDGVISSVILDLFPIKSAYLKGLLFIILRNGFCCRLYDLAGGNGLYRDFAQRRGIGLQPDGHVVYGEVTGEQRLRFESDK